MSQTGVTYYKLENGYPGDVTKGCGLTGSEIDNNFHFLRGYDIRSAEINEEEGTIEISRLNCEKIILEGLEEYIKKIAIEISPESKISFEGSYFDARAGILHLFVNGEDAYQITGFYISAETQVNAGEGLKGRGTIASPLMVDPLHLTGFFAPVKEFLDYEQEQHLPTEKVEKGERYLTREYVTPFGYRYSLEGMNKIKTALEGQDIKGWHIPQIGEWDGLLNAYDCKKNHRKWSKDTAKLYEGEKYGEIAGFALKDICWDEETFKDYGFRILPTEQEDEENNSMDAIFWSQSQSEIGGYHSKAFHKGEGTVEHKVENVNKNWHSVRLVRDLNFASFCETEVILGNPYKCVLMKYENEKGDVSYKVWTSENISYAEDMILNNEYKKPVDFPDITIEGEWRYFLNEYTENGWEKRQFVENDIVMVKNYDGRENEEVILIDGEIIPREDALFEKIKDYVDDAVESAKTEVITYVDEQVSALTLAIEEEESARTAFDEYLEDKIDVEISARTAFDEYLDNKIEKEISARTEADEYLDNKINEEISARTELEEEVRELGNILEEDEYIVSSSLNDLNLRINAADKAIEEEIERAKAAESQLQANIDAEEERAKEAEALLQGNIDAEEIRAKEAEALLQANIDAEEERATVAEEDLQNQINNEIVERKINDIDRSKEYTIGVTNGITLYTNTEGDKGGYEISIAFDGNFGELNF